MRTIPEFIEQLLEAGIEVGLTREGFTVDGFYKSGEVRIVPSTVEGSWICHQRYNKTDTVENLHDIVGINHHWWLHSKERSEFWEQPDLVWAPLLVKFGYIKEKTIPERKVYE
jgi:hypothetical protein